MTPRFALAAALAAALSTSACSRAPNAAPSRDDAAAPTAVAVAPRPPSPSVTAAPPPVPSGPIRTADPSCRTNASLAEGRTSGTAHLVVKGAGLDVDIPDAPAICGPYYTRELKMGNRTYPAGSGLVFEACFAGGRVQAMSDVDATTGKREVGTAPGQVQVSLNTSGGKGFLFSRKAPSSAFVGPGGKSGKFAAGLVAFDGGGPVRVELDVTCAPKSP